MSDKLETIGLDNKSAKERDWIDLQHELGGQDVGRIQRFVASDSGGVYGAEEKKIKEERAYRTMLEILLADDAQYAQAYNKLQNTLDKTQDAVDRATRDLDQKIISGEQELQNMQDNAAVLDDGTRVFKSSEDWKVYTENGRQLSENETQGLKFNDNAPSWEAYKNVRDDLERTRTEREDVRRYQDEVLNPTRQRMNDHENPMSREDIDDAEKRAREELPPSVRSYYTADASVKTEATISVASNLDENSKASNMDLSHEFDKVRTDIPDFSIPETPAQTTPAFTPAGS